MMPLKESDIDEAASLLKERSEFFAVLNAGTFQIKLDITFSSMPFSEDRHIEHWLTRDDALLDHESNDLVWSLLRRRVILIDERLAEIGVEVVQNEDVVPAQAGTQ